ncbi:MAG: nitrilase-related carbon-nitrogen hydrolase, partial [Albidovulum sp.]
MGRTFRLAVGQSPADLSNPQDRLDWLTEALPAIATEGADFLVLPELFATGYNIGDQVVARAESADGPTAQAIAALAKAHG